MPSINQILLQPVINQVRSCRSSNGDTEEILDSSSVSNHTALQLPTFHQFPFLPYELRFQIWELSIFQPRVVEHRRAPDNRSTAPFNSAREAALPSYIFCDGDLRLFLNPSIDTLYFAAHCRYNTIPEFIQRVSRKEWARIERVAIMDCKLNPFTFGDRRQFYSAQHSSFLDGSIFHSVTIWKNVLLCSPEVPTTKFPASVKTLQANTSNYSDDDW